MVTELVTFKMDRQFLREVDRLVKELNYQNRTEFIRNALREKLEEAQKARALAQLKKTYGMGKKYHTTDKELHRIREEVARQMFAEAKQRLRVSGKGRRSATA
jgi:Arc/MetJ-type ribon-helix-helix transcriptional regulator